MTLTGSAIGPAPGSRRIRADRVVADGSFQFRLLPAGDYYVAAAADVDEYEWYDPAFLDRLSASSALKITISEGEKKQLILGPRPPGDPPAARALLQRDGQ